MFSRKVLITVILLLCLIPLAQSASGQIGKKFNEAELDSLYPDLPQFVKDAAMEVGLLYKGQKRYMSFEELAAYCAPVLWYSPDEPLLAKDHGNTMKGTEINLPDAFPFEEQTGKSVVYYRLKNVLAHPKAEEENPLSDSDLEKRNTLIDLKNTSAIDLDYFFYYRSEEGLAAHPHDIEHVEMKLIVIHPRDYPELGYWVVVQRILGKAHGVVWYENRLKVDKYTNLPIHILVEEGKHASCTDQNGDGEYSPGYDVTEQVNDAWGVRDNMRSGYMATGGFTSFMAKDRPKDFRVFPPLPEDSHLREKHSVDGVYAPDNAIYDLRPFPRADPVEESDPHLAHFVASKGSPDWPKVKGNTSLAQFGNWVADDDLWESFSISYRYDQQSGFSAIVPMFILKNFSEPISGGWIVNRIYFKDYQLRDFAWNLMFAPSASRWIDTYFAAGWEWDSDGTNRESHFMAETGIKLRFSISHSPLKFLTGLTDFWGMRVGVKNFGLTDWDYMGFIFELGAGTF